MIDRHSISQIRTSSKACMAINTNGELQGVNSVKRISLRKVRNDSDNDCGCLRTNDTGRLNLALLG